MKNIVKLVCTLIVLGAMVVPTSALSLKNEPTTASFIWNNDNFFAVGKTDDFDPLVDGINVTVTIQEIRALDTMDLLSDPDFYIKVFINGNEFISDVWENSKYVEDPNWSASCEVPKDVEFVGIVIELWSKNSSGPDKLCDIGPQPGTTAEARRAELTYSIATGIWWGDDYLGDPSGYRRLNGCDDGTMYQNDRDAEVFFTISQNDFDSDAFPYWLEVNMYNTSPLMNNRGEDADGDGVPIEWEYIFGLTYQTEKNQFGYYLNYDPHKWENHVALDPDKDGLTNREEYKTWQWGSDPFRKDIFIEIDQMEIGPNGEGSVFPIQAFDLIRDAHARQNIVWHIDDGRLGGGEFIPFKEPLDEDDLNEWYMEYFMHGNAQNWRRGVFRWAIVSYDYLWAPGHLFGSRVNNVRAMDGVFLSTKYHDMRAKLFPLFDDLHLGIGAYTEEINRAYVFGGGLMHETGHTLNIRAPGCDARKSVWPWQTNYWVYANYKSCMNYRYVYRGLVDYSDGSRGGTDYDDWGNIDLTYFNPRN